MTQATVVAQVHQPLDVHRDVATEVTFHHIVAIDGLADLDNLGVGQLVDPTLCRDADLLGDLLGELGADAVYVLQRNQDALIGRYIDASDTSHVALLRTGPS